MIVFNIRNKTLYYLILACLSSFVALWCDYIVTPLLFLISYLIVCDFKQKKTIIFTILQNRSSNNEAE